MKSFQPVKFSSCFPPFLKEYSSTSNLLLYVNCFFSSKYSKYILKTILCLCSIFPCFEVLPNILKGFDCEKYLPLAQVHSANENYTVYVIVIVIVILVVSVVVIRLIIDIEKCLCCLATS